ncbi:MAG: phage portal protein [Acidobacteriota bacterium]|nr:phage portal protein [Acidobacteriota bacterium]
MGLLTRLLGTEPTIVAENDPFDDRWYGSIEQPSASGINVTPDMAMKTSAVYACVRFIAETISTLPLHMYEVRAGGGKDRADDHPLADVISYQPNDSQTAVEFWEMIVGHAVLRGNGYAIIQPGRRGMSDQLIPVHPGRVTPKRLTNGKVRYEITQEDNQPAEKYEQDEIFHLRGLSSDGLTGLSPIALAKDSVGLSLAAESYGARFFSQNANPSGVLEHPGKLGDEAYKRVRSSWQERNAGLENAHKTAILEEGMKWSQIGMTSEDAQFLETRQFQLSDIARWFRVPPHIIGDLVRSTNNNIEHQGIEVVVYTIRPWCVRIEQVTRKSLIAEPKRYFASFVLDGLLRGDSKNRADAFQTMRQNGVINADEWRAYENMNPIEDGSGQMYLQMANMVPLGTEPAEPPPATVELTEEPPKKTDKSRQLAEKAASRLVRKEIVAVRRNAAKLASEPEGWETWLNAFYVEIAGEAVRELGLSPDDAQKYADKQRDDIAYHGVVVCESWEPQRAQELAAMMLEEVAA